MNPVPTQEKGHGYNKSSEPIGYDPQTKLSPDLVTILGHGPTATTFTIAHFFKVLPSLQ